jgi:hypothetical protein
LLQREILFVRQDRGRQLNEYRQQESPRKITQGLTPGGRSPLDRRPEGPLVIGNNKKIDETKKQTLEKELERQR